MVPPAPHPDHPHRRGHARSPDRGAEPRGPDRIGLDGPDLWHLAGERYLDSQAR